jgi:cytochrome c oxidase cbb3-type subunit 2
MARNFTAMLVAACAVGLTLGAVTVVLAASLRRATGDQRLGLCIGAGTGLAYALCNIPWIFHATAAMQTFLAALAVGIASFLPRFMRAGPPPAHRSSHVPAGVVARWVTILLALVWMDSAAFYIVQHTTGLQAAMWNDSSGLVTNAAIHLLAALAAGAALDRGRRRTLAAGSVGALAVACLMLNGAIPAVAPAAWFYTAGVSLYSTVLVEFPARSGRPWHAAVVFAVAGWVGSAMGIGLAQDLATVPAGFVVSAVAAVAIALLWRRRPSVQIAAALTAMTLGPGMGRADDPATGREVYIGEGCIHCHSQFIRPRHATEVQLWGPATQAHEALAGTPPLIGTRRQGPDLSQIGNRRSPEWNRLHLIAPREISPGSRMPSYEHLFAPGSQRGDALVAYLASLGVESIARRDAQIAAWTPELRSAIPPDQAQRLFLRLCAQCHGDAGRGDGPLAARLSLRPPDWTQEPWRRVPAGAAPDITLSRIIKFGLRGGPMAGHEYLPDAEIVGLARFVESMHTSGGGGATAVAEP